MSSRREVSGTVTAWKQHGCGHCGALYSYHFGRELSATGKQLDAARSALEDRARQALTQIESHPCPCCGTIQPEMIASQLVPEHLLGLVVGSIGSLLPLLLHYGHYLHGATAAVLSAIAVGLAGWLHFSGLYIDANKDLDDNLERATNGLEKGRLAIIEEGDPDNPAGSLPGPVNTSWTIGLLGGCIALLVLPVPLRLAKGWPTNSNLYPGVLGPGDVSTCYLETRFHALSGYWRGECTAELLDGKQPTGRVIPSETRTEGWPDSFSARKGGDGYEEITPWVRLRLPSDSPLADSELRVRLTLTVTQPSMTQEHMFDEVKKTHVETVVLKTGSAGAGRFFSRLIWIGLIAGSLSQLLVGIWLLLAAKRFGDTGEAVKTLEPLLDDEPFEEARSSRSRSRKPRRRRRR